jgi:hypothetical protein
MAAFLAWAAGVALKVAVVAVVGAIIKESGGQAVQNGSSMPPGGPNNEEFKKWAKQGAHAYDGYEVKQHGAHAVEHFAMHK